MTTGSRTEGVRGIGSNGFIRTVANLTVTGDLVVLGENRALAGTGSFFWEDADANAEYWAFELPTGTSQHVPVLGVGVGLDGVDLGLFDGITQPTMAVIDADRDSFIALDFSGDDAARLRANAAMTISTSTAALTLTPTTDVHVSNGTGLVIGHTAQVTNGQPGELQVLGTGAADSMAILGRWSADSGAPELAFVKSRDPAIADGSFAIVSNGDPVGQIRFYPDDGADFQTLAAQFRALVDDSSAAAGDIGMAFVWSQMPGGGGAIAETMRLTAAGSLTFNQATTISTSTGNLILTGSGQIVDIQPTDSSSHPTRLRITSLDTGINSSGEEQQGSVDFYTSDSGNVGVHARILAYADTNTRLGLKFIVGSAGADTERMVIRSTGEVGVANGAPKLLLGTPQTYATTQPTNLLQIHTGTAPAGAITNSVGLYTGGTVMSKIIADGTITNVEA